MKSDTTHSTFAQPEAETAVYLFDDSAQHCLMSPVSRALSHETPPCGSRRTALAEIRKSTPCKANCCKTPCDQRFLTKALIARINPDISRRRVMASAV